MARGRGSASSGVVLMGAVLLVGFLAASAPLAGAASYMVGGWKVSAAGWAKGKAFIRAGDELVFNYNPATHDVAIVDAAAYRSCRAPEGAKVMRSGRDKVRLGKGTHYFVCTQGGHCQHGMKLAVRAV